MDSKNYRIWGHKKVYQWRGLINYIFNWMHWNAWPWAGINISMMCYMDVLIQKWMVKQAMNRVKMHTTYQRKAQDPGKEMKWMIGQWRRRNHPPRNQCKIWDLVYCPNSYTTHNTPKNIVIDLVIKFKNLVVSVHFTLEKFKFIPLDFVWVKIKVERARN